MPRKFSVLIYSGPGVSPSSLSHTLKSLRSLLSPYYTVNALTPESLLADPWTTQCALLIFPGGRDIPFHEMLKGRGNELIAGFVRGGGSFMGICAGGYYGASEIRFMMDDPIYKVHDDRELGFWEGTCEGTVFPGFQYSSEKGTRLAEMAVDVDAIRKVLEQDGRKVSPDLKSSVPVYYNGGGAFVPPAADSGSSSYSSSAPVVLARYAEAPDQPNATVLMRVGAGRALLCGTHPEFSFHEDPLLGALERLSGGGPSAEERIKLEEGRVELMKALLLTLDIGLPDSEDKDKLTRPTHPLPQFLMSHPSKPDLPTKFVDKISSLFTSPTDEPAVLPDGNDTFHFHKSTTFESVSSYISEARSATLSIEQSDNMDRLIKHIIVADKEQASPTFIDHERWTPLFDWPTFWSSLDAARKLVLDQGGHDAKEGQPRLGDQMLYSEAVTSTQTMLDKNPKLLHTLPTPLVSTASYQLSGRGRAGNVWLSPTGCLQFTMALTLPPSMGRKVVFIQYLAALAIVEALDPSTPGSGRSEGVLGVRIKWPNDVYALVKGDGGKIDKVKMGGILVNSNYANGQFRIMVGCGVNILNALPTTSLALLTQIHNGGLGETEEKREVPTMEGSLARILARFGSMWEQFLDAPGGGFEPFLTDYLDRWLHSDQLVHLLTTNPPTPVRITTITLDHGLLRTTPIKTNRDAYGGEYDGFRTRMATMGLNGNGNGKQEEEEERYIDLQPDGNSFDIMAGMIRAKR